MNTLCALYECMHDLIIAVTDSRLEGLNYGNPDGKKCAR